MTGRTQHLGTKRDRPRGVVARRTGVHQRTIKSADGIRCRTCGLVQLRGTWSHADESAPPAGRTLCPACTRVRDHYPAGVVTIPAGLDPSTGELMRLVRNLETSEREEHPLERVMEIKSENGALVVTTTGVHLARHIAHKLAKRFHAKPRIRYADAEELVHVDWALPRVKSAPRKRRR